MNMGRIRLAGLALALALSTAVGAESGKVLRACAIHEKPFLEASKTGDLDAQTDVEILARNGGWMQVRSAAGQTGWVRLLNVQPVSTEASAGSSLLGGLAKLGNVASTGSTGTTATTGAKGISQEDLAQAQPSLTELAKLEGLPSSAANGRRHAANHQLRAQVSEPLDPRPGERGTNATAPQQ
ncbi:MAG: SH3 domain-containing protein [Rhodocyclales bacterium]|nr:SH3 domain-containing protein [Rhodocyclales bacterium]